MPRHLRRLFQKRAPQEKEPASNTALDSGSSAVVSETEDSRPSSTTPGVSGLTAASFPATDEIEEYGLKVLVEKDDAVVESWATNLWGVFSIIAIHGLNGHREKTWTAYRNGNGVNWLQHPLMLPNVVPNARIMTWGYDATTHRRGRIAKITLYGHSSNLVSELTTFRKSTKTFERPIIFIVHSLGGIILKDALLLSQGRNQSNRPDQRSIKTSTYGIIFMGTPHQGGHGTDLGQLVLQVASIWYDTKNDYLKNLKQDSEHLEQQLDSYKDISSEFETIFCYEAYETTLVSRASIHVVPKSSAVIPGQANAEDFPIMADHVNMVKFSSPESNDFKRVAAHLKIMAEDGLEKVKENWKVQKGTENVLARQFAFSHTTSEPLKARKKELLDWLCGVDPSQISNTKLGQHQKGTGEWLLSESEEFNTWKTSSSSLLWLHGKAGSGKSVLSSIVTKHLEVQCEESNASAVAQFFFSFSNQKQQALDEMLASLVMQLCAAHPSIPEPLEKLGKYMDRRARPDSATLEETLINVSLHFSGHLYIIIDGLDECPESNGERERLLGSLSHIVSNMPSHLHIFCTSRKEDDINGSMETILCPPSRVAIDLETNAARINDDIERYINSTLASVNYRWWTNDLKAAAKASLVEKADSMFQYVSCQFAELKNLDSLKLIRDALNKLPSGLDETYERMLLNIDPRFQKQVAGLLKWLAFSTRPLQLRELAEIFVLQPGRTCPIDESERVSNPESILKHIQSLVVVYQEKTNLVHFDKDNDKESKDNKDDEDSEDREDREDDEDDEDNEDNEDTKDNKDNNNKEDNKDEKNKSYYHVRLSHFSIKEYLLSSRIMEGQASAYGFKETVAHQHIAESCLAYHIYRSQSILHYKYFVRSHPISNLEIHAASEWAVHLELVPREQWPDSITRMASKALAIRSKSLCRIIRINSSHSLTSHFDSLEEIMSLRPFCYTARSGLSKLTDMLLCHGLGLMNNYLTQEDFDIGLVSATRQGNMKIIELFVCLGADVNTANAGLGRPLHIAASKGYVEVAVYLLKNGADIDAIDDKVGSPQEAAALAGKLEMLEFLVRRRSGVKLASGGAQCALPAIINHSSEFDRRVEDCIRFLLDNGADINAHDETFGTALSAACFKSFSTEFIQMLLERGADVNAPGGANWGNALQAACKPSVSDLDEADPDEGVINLLLDWGADINATSDLHGSPLCQLCSHWKFSRKLVSLLLDRGADVRVQGGKYGNALQATCCNNANGPNYKMAKLLLDRGADVNARGGYYGNALQAACQLPEIGVKKKIVDLLLDRGADVNALGGEYGTALQAASWCRESSVGILELLLDAGAEINKQGGYFGNALQAACASGDEKAVIFLLNRGADMDVRGGQYETALQAACTRGSSIARLLIERGADIHAQGGEYGSAWHALWTVGWPPGDMEGVVQLLLDCGVDINDTWGREHATALEATIHWPDDQFSSYFTGATLHTFARRFRFLINRGADMSLAVEQYGSLLQSACARQYVPEIAELLLNIYPSINVNAQGGLFGSALQAASYRGHTTLVSSLLDKGADINMRGGKCQSALNAAIIQGYWDMVEILLDRGAQPDCHILSEIDNEWLEGFREEHGRGAIERYHVFWDKNKTADKTVT